MMNFKNRRTMSLYIAAILSAFIALGLFWQVKSLADIVPFHDWDEAIYAQVAKEFARAPSFLLTYNSQPWFEKPPLLGVLFSLAWILPFKPELVARLVSLAFSLSSLLILYKISRSLKINYLASITAIFIALQSPMFRDRSVLVNVDIMLTSGWLLYALGAANNSYSFKLVGLLIGVFSKSLLGFIPMIAHIASSLIFQKATKRSYLEWLSMTFFGSLWYAYMIVVYKEPFLKSHFLDHLVARVYRPIELHFGDKWYYLERIWEQTNVFSILAVFGILYVTYRFSKQLLRSKTLAKSTHIFAMLAIIPVSYLALLTISKSKLHWYITPIIPFIGLWVGILLHNLQENKNTLIRKTSLVGGILLLAYCVYTFSLSITHIPKDWFTPTDKTLIGICVGKYVAQNDSITYLVPPQERVDANVIEAAQLQIGSSFIYGSAPAFLYYSDRPVSFVYKDKLLKGSLSQSNLLVISRSDLKDPTTRTTISDWLKIKVENTTPLCDTESLVAYRKVPN